MPTTTRTTIAIPQQFDPVTVLGPVDEVWGSRTCVPRSDHHQPGQPHRHHVAFQQTESCRRAEQVVADIIQAAYTAPMDADTVRRMLDQNVLKNPVRPNIPATAGGEELAQSASGNSRTRPIVLETGTRRRTQAHGSRRHHLRCRQTGPCQNRRTDSLRQRHRIAHHHLRHRDRQAPAKPILP